MINKKMNNPIQIVKETCSYIVGNIKWIIYCHRHNIKIKLNRGYFIFCFNEIRDRCFLGIKPEECEEIATINVFDNDGIFPIKEFKVRVYGRDKKYRYFHVEGKGWDIVFEPNRGKFIRINQEGDDKRVRNYITKNVKKWLNDYNPNDKLSNRMSILDTLDFMD